MVKTEIEWFSLEEKRPKDGDAELLLYVKNPLFNSKRFFIYGGYYVKNSNPAGFVNWNAELNDFRCNPIPEDNIIAWAYFPNPNII